MSGSAPPKYLLYLTLPLLFFILSAPTLETNRAAPPLESNPSSPALESNPSSPPLESNPSSPALESNRKVEKIHNSPLPAEALAKASLPAEALAKAGLSEENPLGEKETLVRDPFLDRFLPLGGIEFVSFSDQLLPKVRSSIYFAFDSSELDTRAKEIISQLARVMIEYDDFTYLIVGHADGRGTDDHNQKLISRRQNSVRDHLIATFKSHCVKLKGCGEAEERVISTPRHWHPVSLHSSTERAENRRVEIYLLRAVGATQRFAP